MDDRPPIPLGCQDTVDDGLDREIVRLVAASAAALHHEDSAASAVGLEDTGARPVRRSRLARGLKARWAFYGQVGDS
jgi:hypothetical protein